MEKLVKIATLHNMLQHENAEMNGLHELSDCGYEEDMKEMYTVHFDNVIIERDARVLIEKIEQVQMASWGHMRLYDSDKVVAFKFEGDDALYTLYDEDAEWCMI